MDTNRADFPNSNLLLFLRKIRPVFCGTNNPRLIGRCLAELVIFFADAGGLRIDAAFGEILGCLGGGSNIDLIGIASLKVDSDASIQVHFAELGILVAQRPEFLPLFERGELVSVSWRSEKEERRAG